MFIQKEQHLFFLHTKKSAERTFHDFCWLNQTCSTGCQIKSDLLSNQIFFSPSSLQTSETPLMYITNNTNRLQMKVIVLVQLGIHEHQICALTYKLNRGKNSTVTCLCFVTVLDSSMRLTNCVTPLPFLVSLITS